MGGKTRNIAIQLVLRQCCKTGCTFVVARVTVALRLYIQYHFTLVTSSYYVHEIYKPPETSRNDPPEAIKILKMIPQQTGRPLLLTGNKRPTPY